MGLVQAHCSGVHAVQVNFKGAFKTLRRTKRKKMTGPKRGLQQPCFVIADVNNGSIDLTTFGFP
jgi:hypothetical protein